MRCAHHDGCVGHVEHGEDQLRKAGWCVDDHIVGLLLKVIDRLLHRGDGDELSALG